MNEPLDSVSLDPRGEAGNTNINTRELRKSTTEAPRADTDYDTVVVERAAGVTLTLVATTDVKDAGTQHVVSNGATTSSIARPAGVLVHSPDLNVA